jgi:hypothetical protein
MTYRPYSFIESIENRLRSVSMDDPTAEIVIWADERSGDDAVEAQAQTLSLAYTARPLVENEDGDLVLGEITDEEIDGGAIGDRLTAMFEAELVEA